jgi:hypothetical protein
MDATNKEFKQAYVIRHSNEHIVLTKVFDTKNSLKIEDICAFEFKNIGR